MTIRINLSGKENLLDRLGFCIEAEPSDIPLNDNYVCPHANEGYCEGVKDEKAKSRCLGYDSGKKPNYFNCMIYRLWSENPELVPDTFSKPEVQQVNASGDLHAEKNPYDSIDDKISDGANIFRFIGFGRTLRMQNRRKSEKYRVDE